MDVKPDAATTFCRIDVMSHPVRRPDISPGDMALLYNDGRPIGFIGDLAIRVSLAPDTPGLVFQASQRRLGPVRIAGTAEASRPR